MTASAGSRGPSASSLFRHPDFVRFWTAQTVAQFGSQVSLLAIPLVAISFLGSSAVEVALLSTMEFLPFVFFALPAGVWIDRLRRRPILIGADVGRALLLATIPVAWIAGFLTIWQLYVVAFLVGVLTVFFDVAYQAYLPSLVERERILDGNAKLETSRSVAQTAGPAIAGWLIGVLTAPIAIIVNSASFIASGIALLAIRREEPSPTASVAAREADGTVAGDGAAATHPASAGLRHEVADGLRYVFADPNLRAIALSMSWANFAGQIVYSLFFVYAVRELGLEAGALGVILGIGNIGLIVGALTATRVARRLGLGRAIVLSIFVAGAATLLIPLAPANAPAPFLIAQGLVFGWAVLVFNINQVSYRQAITPEHLQGRMNATMKFIATLMIPAGSVAGGILAATVGLHGAILVGAVGGVFCVVPVALSPVRSLRGIEPGGTGTTLRAPGLIVDSAVEPPFGEIG